jgi:hypothetical protein
MDSKDGYLITVAFPSFQIHFPFPTFSNTTLMDGLKEVRDLGLADAVGVSNYSLAQVSKLLYTLFGRLPEARVVMPQAYRDSTSSTTHASSRCRDSWKDQLNWFPCLSCLFVTTCLAEAGKCFHHSLVEL